MNRPPAFFNDGPDDEHPGPILETLARVDRIAAIDDTVLIILYYALSLRVRLPPLRERPEDILPLARYFLGPEAAPRRRNREAVPGCRKGALLLRLARERPGSFVSSPAGGGSPAAARLAALSAP